MYKGARYVMRYLLVTTNTDGVYDNYSNFELFTTEAEALEQATKTKKENEYGFFYHTIVKFDPKTGKEINQEHLDY